MKQNLQPPATPLEMLSLFFPAGLLDYFDLVNHAEIEVQDFPVRGKAVYLRIKRRRWEDPETGQTYSRDWNLVASGTRITAEFGAFLKALLRQSCG